MSEIQTKKHIGYEEDVIVIPDAEKAAEELAKSDVSMVRVVEDLVNLLVSKNIIAVTELPVEAQAKLATRTNLRDNLKVTTEPATKS